MDTTERILRELETMINEGSFFPELEEQIQSFIAKIRNGEINLNSYKNSKAKKNDGSDIIEVLIEANRRRYEKGRNHGRSI